MRIAWQLATQLGEGPVWIAGDEALWFVDILAGHLHRFDPASGTGTTFDVGGMPSFIADLGRDGLLVGDRAQLMRFADGGYREAVAALPGASNNRTNDATVGPDGRLWFGTMDRECITPTGQFHCFDRGVITAYGGYCAVTNGPAVSPDGQWLYCVDTLDGAITRYPIDPAGPLGEGSKFASILPADGYPDGVSVDGDGFVWVALWGGACVRRYAPDGTLERELAVPCSNPTKIGFGGPGLTTAYVTSARTGLSEDELADQPLAGALFAFDPPSPGHLVPAVILA